MPNQNYTANITFVVTRKGDDVFKKIQADTAKIAAGVEQMDSKVKGASKGIGFLDVAMGNLVADGLAAAARGVKEFIGGSIDLASSAAETTSLLENSLGPAAEGFTQQIADMADATRRSAVELEAGASTIVAMTKSMGFGQQAAADYSGTMAQVAVDLGSFFNQSTEQVFQDLQSALAGSSETMLKYGIDVKETQLKNAAYEMGLIEQGETLDRVTRATVLQAEVIRQAADAMGDAERTAGSYSNTQRGLEAAAKDLQVAIGDALIPALTVLANEAIPAVQEAAEEAGPALIQLGEQAAKKIELMANTSAWDELRNRVAQSGVNFQELNEVIGEGRVGFDLWRTAADIEDDLNRQQTGIIRMTAAMEALNLGLEAGSEEYFAYIDAQEDSFRASKRNELVAIALNEAYGYLFPTVEEAAEAQADYAEKTAEATAAAYEAEGAFLDLDYGALLLAGHMIDLQISTAEAGGAFSDSVGPLGEYYTVVDKARGITKDTRDEIIRIKEELFGVEPAAKAGATALGTAAGEMWVAANKAKTEVALLNDELDGIEDFYASEIKISTEEAMANVQALLDLLNQVDSPGPMGAPPPPPTSPGAGGGGNTGGDNEFQTGGYTGSTGGTVHPFEYVIRPEAVKGIGLPALEMMNQSGRLPASLGHTFGPHGIAETMGMATAAANNNQTYVNVNNDRQFFIVPSEGDGRALAATLAAERKRAFNRFVLTGK